ncbi:MAG: hypothetical protein PHD43_15140 [Methylococcales bacterium]|nr:hypothetical protein [Methylococcales bacterium]
MEKVNKFNTTTVRPEPVEGQLPGALQVPQVTCGISLFQAEDRESMNQSSFPHFLTLNKNLS